MKGSEVWPTIVECTKEGCSVLEGYSGGTAGGKGTSCDKAELMYFC